jgi:malate dehydrogenase (oxaloacetate-decarboxylating)
MNYNEASLKLHKEKQGKISIQSKVAIDSKEALSIAYTPGVAEPCRVIATDKRKVYDYTSKGNIVAVITDGSAVLGLGNIGPEASLPVMEGKAILFKEFGNIDAFPIALTTQDVEEIIQTVKRISPGLGGINLEDISAPRCFTIEERLKKELDIPVFHDDQHGTAIVVLAGLINSLKLTGKTLGNTKIIISGAGAAGVAITKLLLDYGAKDITLVDREGAIYSGRIDNMNPVKESLALITNKERKKGDLGAVIKKADIFIGVSSAGLLTKDMVQSMNKNAIIFAMANPIPEIMPEDAKAGGAAIIATGRSDYSNQINNVLAFPGVFRGTFDAHATEINEAMKIAAAEALAHMVKKPTPDKIIPSPFEEGLATIVAAAVKKAAITSHARVRL